MISVLSSFVSLFIFYTLSYLLSKTMGCFSGRLMTSASNEKLFCEVCSVFSYSFDEFVGERVVSPSQSSTVLAPPPVLYYSCLWFYQCNAGHIEFSRKLSFFLNFQKEFVQSCHFSSLYWYVWWNSPLVWTRPGVLCEIGFSYIFNFFNNKGVVRLSATWESFNSLYI